MSRLLQQELSFTYLLENATASALTSLAKQLLSQEGIALLPCSKVLRIFQMVPLLTTTWQ